MTTATTEKKHSPDSKDTLPIFKGTLSPTRMRQILSSKLEKFRLNFSSLNRQFQNGVDLSRRSLGGKLRNLVEKGILEKKSSFDKARKRCHKRIFGNEIIISRILRYKTS